MYAVIVDVLPQICGSVREGEFGGREAAAAGGACGMGHVVSMLQYIYRTESHTRHSCVGGDRVLVLDRRSERSPRSERASETWGAREGAF